MKEEQVLCQRRLLRRVVRDHDIRRWLDNFLRAAADHPLSDFPLVGDDLPAAAAQMAYPSSITASSATLARSRS